MLQQKSYAPKVAKEKQIAPQSEGHTGDSLLKGWLAEAFHHHRPNTKEISTEVLTALKLATRTVQGLVESFEID